MNIDADKIYNDATQEGLALARELLSKSPEFVQPTALTLGAAVGSVYGAIRQTPHPESEEFAKKWLEAFFLTMTGGLRKTMGIDLDIVWTIKNAKKEI